MRARYVTVFWKVESKQFKRKQESIILPAAYSNGQYDKYCPLKSKYWPPSTHIRHSETTYRGCSIHEIVLLLLILLATMGTRDVASSLLTLPLPCLFSTVFSDHLYCILRHESQTWFLLQCLFALRLKLLFNWHLSTRWRCLPPDVAFIIFLATAYRIFNAARRLRISTLSESTGLSL